MSYPVTKYQSDPTSNHPTNGNDYPVDNSSDTLDWGDGYGLQDINQQDQYVQGQDGEGNGSEPALTVDDLRGQVKDLLNLLNQNKTLSADDKTDLTAAINKLNTEINGAVFLKPQQQATKLSDIEANILYFQTNIGGNPGSDWGNDPNSGGGLVTRHTVQDLIDQIQNGERPLADGATVTKDQCVSQLQEAITDIQNGDFQNASNIYNQVLSSLGGVQTPEQLAGALFGGTPSKVDGDNIHYDCKDGDTSLDLKEPDSAHNAKTITVDNASNVNLTPANAGDSVSVSHEGGYYVVTIGSDTFKINDSAKLHISSDHVTGDIDNTDGNVTVGASDSTNKNYISPDKLNHMADLIDGSTSEVNLGDDNKNNTVKNILSEITAAIKETDPKKQADAWSTVQEDLERLSSEGTDPGTINDMAQTVFNVMYDGLGKQGFQDALEQGIIPQDFANKLAEQITIKDDENTNSDSKDHANGGPKWTHQTSANFLKDHSSKSS